ncbi:MAG: lysylphosphatidylglycerol synthase transmembrane domain-containing protein [Candidatus Altiarchaeota archaeon]
MYKRAILLFLGIAILAFTLYMVDFYKVLEIIATFPLRYLLILLFIEILIIIFSSIKWKVVLKEKISTAALIPISIVGYLFTNITPIGIAGGEPVRAYLLYKIKKIPIERSFASVIVDLFLEILPIFFLAVISIFLIIIKGIEVEIALMLVFLTFLLFFLFLISINLVINPSLSHKLIEVFIKCISYVPILKRRAINFKSKIYDIQEKFTNAVKESMIDFNVLLFGTIISCLKWLLVLFRVYLIAIALNIKVLFSHVLIVETSILILSGIPLIPGSLGIWEGASVLLFSIIAEISATEAAAITLIDRSLFYLLPSIIGAILSVHYGINILKEEEFKVEEEIKERILTNSKR